MAHQVKRRLPDASQGAVAGWCAESSDGTALWTPVPAGDSRVRMDRRQRKLQEKRKKRELSKKRSRLEAERRPSEEQLLVRAGARAPFGPCFISSGWDDSVTPRLVSLVITRALDGG